MKTATLNKSETPKNFVSFLLQSELLKHFEYQGIYELCDVKSKEVYYKVFLKEIAKLPYGFIDSDIEFIDHLSPVIIQDIPMHGKSVILNITLKGWWKKDNKQELIISKYSFFTEDLIFTQRLFEKYNFKK